MVLTHITLSTANRWLLAFRNFDMIRYYKGKPPVSVPTDRGSGEGYVVPSKTAAGSTIQFLPTDCCQELLAVYTDGFHAYEPHARMTQPPVNTLLAATVSMLIESPYYHSLPRATILFTLIRSMLATN